ncbi:AbrB/MazE/SpoVT family DNA-binding domain-containing protein [Nanoarchaeota archaeon]
MEKRRLVKAGAASHTVSLPKSWLRKNNLTKGDDVIVYEENNILHITPTAPTKTKLKKVTINVDEKNIHSLAREVTSAYINNHNEITLFGETLSNNVKEIRRILHDFVAMEITEQTSKRIIAKDLLNPKELSVGKTITRMDMIVRSMFSDILENCKKHKESIFYRDYDVNRMYFLLYRILKASLKDPKLAKDISLNNEDILSSLHLITNIESLADFVKNLTDYYHKSKDKGTKEILTSLSKIYERSMKSYYLGDKALADSIAQERLDLTEEIDKLPTRFSENYKSILTMINNIARVTLDKEY